MTIEEATELFRRRLQREPSAEETQRMKERLERGRDIRKVIAGFMAMDYHRAQRGPDAMSQIRSHRRQRGSDRPQRAGRGDAAELRQKMHAAVDALVDYLEAGGRPGRDNTTPSPD